MLNKTGLYVNPLLTQISLAYRNEDYIADKIMPIVPVKKDSAQITTYGMDNLRVANSIRAQGSATNEINHTVSIGKHYFLKEHALKELVTNEEIDNADQPIQPKKDATENLVDRICVIKEKLLADVMSNTSVITQNVTLAGTDQWSDYDNSDPISDIRTAIESVRSNSGKIANTIAMSHPVWMFLLQHPDMVNRVKVGMADSESVMKIIMTVFPSIKNVLVASAQYNSGVEGGADSLADIWGKHAWALYVEPKPTLKSRSFGFTYQGKENKMVDETGPQSGGEAWNRKGTFIRVTDKYDQKLIDAKCAYLIKDAVA